MAANRFFSPCRFWAIVAKEFIQMRRDRVTLAMMLGIPLMQIILFGFAINMDPKHLPTAVLSGDNSVFSRDIVAAMQNSRYFKVVKTIHSRERADELLQLGEVQFVLTIPANFGRDLARGDRPVLLLEADATDPGATGNAIGRFERVIASGLGRDLTGPLAWLNPAPSPVDLRVHARYNPEAVTQYNVVPGLMGVILTLTLIIITGLCITRERERGTMENLLATPVRPLEVMIGKILPYILIGYVQILLITGAALFLFHVPMLGSFMLILAASSVFIAANLAVGLMFSTVAKNQLQAMQLAFFFFLPSILLSGFMFPFRGMPAWAQFIGEALPLTHYLRFVRGVMLKGDTWVNAWPHIWPIMVFLAAVILIGRKRYSQTLD